MDAARKIVQINEAGPRIAKAKSKKTLAFAVGFVVVLAGVAIALQMAAGGETGIARNVTTETVTAAPLVSSTEASGTVVVPTQITIVSPEEGYADTVLVSEGENVSKNQILALLDVPDLVDARDDLLSQLSLARIGLRELENDYAFSIAQLETSVKRLDVQVADAQAEVDTKKALISLLSSKQAEYEDALDALTAVQENREDALANLSNTKIKRDLALEKQRANIEALNISLSRNAESIEAARIKSPLSGEVLSIASALKVPGSLIAKNAEIVTVADKSDTYIDLEVEEQYAAQLLTGSEISVTVGTTALTAAIVSVGKVASLASDGLTATVAVRARPSGDASLTPGASAVASITLGVKKDALTLPRGAYLTTGGQKYVYKVVGNTAIKTEVTFGSIQGSKVEIVKGLQAGDIVITSGYQDFIGFDTVTIE